MTVPETHRFRDDGRFPNSPLPLLIYRRGLTADPAQMEKTFEAHGWSNGWRNGIYDFHHFHSIAHEVLGIACGWGDVAFCGPSGRTLRVDAGDVVAIPAGVGHCNVGQSEDFLVVGAYPGGSKYDIRRGDPGEHDAVARIIGCVALPRCDPVQGEDGDMLRLWSGA